MTATRVAIITGASRGLGAVIAKALAVRKYDLVIGARHSEPLQQVAHALARHAGRVVPVDGDITDTSVRAGLIDAARELGGLNVLVNNASELGGIGPLIDFDVTRFGRLFPVNTGAPIALIQAAVPLLAERQGLIVNVTSDAARDGGRMVRARRHSSC
jgi:NAD(P)-dependent dehydrogenase (short-subunit alcohol dehydrogenase family)